MILRKANIQDVKIYWKWFNDSEIKKNSFNYKKTTYKDHKTWFLDKLNKKENYLFVGSINNIPCSQVRIELINKNYVVSYSVSYAYRGKGIGKKMINKVLKKLIKFKNLKKYPIVARVKKQNTASVKIFEYFNFAKRHYKEYYFFKKYLR